MKKFIVLVFAIFMSISVAYSVTVEKETITVTYAADTPSVIGFSAGAVNFATPAKELPEVLFNADSSGKYITDEFYIYWQLYSQDKVIISLTMEPMTLESSTLHYQVESFYELNTLRTDSNTYKTGTVVDESGQIINGFRMACMPIALRLISNNDTIEKGDYLGSLTLTLEVI